MNECLTSSLRLSVYYAEMFSILTTRWTHTGAPPLRWTGVPHYHWHQWYERGSEWETKPFDVVHGTFRLPLVLHGEPVVENDLAYMHGAAHHLGHTWAHRTFPPGMRSHLLPGNVNFGELTVTKNQKMEQKKSRSIITNLCLYFFIHDSDYCCKGSGITG